MKNNEFNIDVAVTRELVEDLCNTVHQLKEQLFNHQKQIRHLEQRLLPSELWYVNEKR